MKKQEGTARRCAHKIFNMLMDISEKTGRCTDFSICRESGDGITVCVIVRKSGDISSGAELLEIKDMEDVAEYRSLVKKLNAFMKKAPDVGASGAVRNGQ